MCCKLSCTRDGAFARRGGTTYVAVRSETLPSTRGVIDFWRPDMPTNDEVADTATATAARISADAQKTVAEAAKRIEAAVQQGLEQVRTQSRVYADAAGEQLDEASRIASEQIRARPLAATGLALGVGVLIGLLLSAGRR